MRATRTHRWLTPLVIGGLMVLLLPAVAIAATEADKQDAIDDGLAYLAGSQRANGSWYYDNSYGDTAATGAALLAFLEEGHTTTSGAYSAEVTKAVNYLMGQATSYSISNEPAGNPDSDGNGIGIKFVPGGNNSRDTYVTGLVMTALGRMDPNATVATGAFTGWTYKQVVQNTMDYFAYGQADSGWARGDWRYYADYNQSDNSTAQWPAVGALFSQSMGVDAPDFVKDELAHWIGYIQNTNGGSGYSTPTQLVNESKTGGLLAQMLLAGDDTGGTDYDLSHPDVQAALAYINTNWGNGPSFWDGNIGNPYAMWSVYKGLEGMVGLDDTTWITNIGAQGGASIDPGDTWNWWEEYCEWLVNNQNASGNWTGHYYWTGALATAWNINILNATSVHDPVVPEPSTIALLGLGLAGIAFAARRRRKAG